MVLSAASENIWRSLPAGLRRSKLGGRASGANTNPPCASPANKANRQSRGQDGEDPAHGLDTGPEQQRAVGPDRVGAGGIQRHCEKSGPAGDGFAIHEPVTPATAAIARAPVSSRERVTCPRSRARCRCRGVARSVLFVSAIVMSMHQMEQLVASANGIQKQAPEKIGPILQCREQNEQTEKTFDRGSEQHQRHLRRRLTEKPENHIRNQRGR